MDHSREKGDELGSLWEDGDRVEVDRRGDGGSRFLALRPVVGPDALDWGAVDLGHGRGGGAWLRIGERPGMRLKVYETDSSLVQIRPQYVVC